MGNLASIQHYKLTTHNFVYVIYLKNKTGYFIIINQQMQSLYLHSYVTLKLLHVLIPVVSSSGSRNIKPSFMRH